MGFENTGCGCVVTRRSLDGESLGYWLHRRRAEIFGWLGGRSEGPTYTEASTAMFLTTPAVMKILEQFEMQPPDPEQIEAFTQTLEKMAIDVLKKDDDFLCGTTADFVQDEGLPLKERRELQAKKEQVRRQAEEALALARETYGDDNEYVAALSDYYKAEEKRYEIE